MINKEILNIIEIRDACQQIADIYYNKMKDAEYNPEGDLMRFKWVTELKGNVFELDFVLPSYWEYAEYGSRGTLTGLPDRKGPPPIAPILKWIKFKQLVPRPSNEKVPTTKQMAYAIRQNIYKYGTQGKHLLQQTIDSPDMDNLIDKLSDAIADKLLEKIEKQLEEI